MEGSWMRLWDTLRPCLLLKYGVLIWSSNSATAPGCILAQFQGKIAFCMPLKIVQAIVIPKQHHQASDPRWGQGSSGALFEGHLLPMSYPFSIHFFIFLHISSCLACFFLCHPFPYLQILKHGASVKIRFARSHGSKILHGFGDLTSKSSWSSRLYSLAPRHPTSQTNESCPSNGIWTVHSNSVILLLCFDTCM